MISIIIPTLASNDLSAINYTVKEALSSDYIEQIIIIDNSGGNLFYQKTGLKHNKLVIVGLDRNIFVNPAWNLGVALSKSKHIIIMNDDVYCSQEIYKSVHLGMSCDNVGLCTVKSIKINNLQEYISNTRYFKSDLSVIEHCEQIGWFFCVNRKLWKNIPNDLKIFYGDDFIYDRINNLGYKALLIDNCSIGHLGSVTVNKINKIEDILKAEGQIYIKIKNSFV